MVEEKESVAQRDFLRMELRSLVKLASEPISHFWPMKTFIHHNPLHGLEHLPFEQAIEEGTKYLGGAGYLSNTDYQHYYRQGRISNEAINDVLARFSDNNIITIGDRKISHLEILRTILINGTGILSPDVSSAILPNVFSEPGAEKLVENLKALLEKRDADHSLGIQAARERSELGAQYTIAHWCDEILGTKIQDQINQELIKWCGGFLDEGQAAWPMPLRSKSFYGGWKILAQEDFAGWLFGIRDWKTKIQNLSDRPEDAILESLEILRIPRNMWTNYFTLHLAQLSGWTGLIKWRSEQSDYAWQLAYPIDLIKYMAVRLFYERELVALACQTKLGIPGTYDAIQSLLNDFSHGYGLTKAWRTKKIPQELMKDLDLSLFIREPLPIQDLNQAAHSLHSRWEAIRKHQTLAQKSLIVRHVARSVDIPLIDLVASPPEALGLLLDWIEDFPESRHGPVWLKAFERSYLTTLLKHLAPNLVKLSQSDAKEEGSSDSRPLAQSMFCIDVRSESFRRHLEEVGGNETFGFAGFFGVPICYQGFGSEHETDQCPVLLKPKHKVKEVPRAYQGRAAEKYLERQQLAKTGHELLHDLKENVITPYVMVEAIGWFFGLRLFGQTLAPRWYKTMTAWIKKHLTIPMGTTLTVEKLTQAEAQEMVASEQRATIYRLLIEQYGRVGMAVSHDQVEQLRKHTLNEIEPNEVDENLLQLLQWTEADQEKFIRDLRRQHDVHERAMDRRMQKITQSGFTMTEQAYFVETALRVLGFTKTFARLVLVCAHGSTSDNNPYESALDCGACGGNQGVSNARAFAAMANSPPVRELLAQRGLHIPLDTHFLPGQHDTTTDEVRLFDLEDVPATHRKDLLRLLNDLEEASRRNSYERLSRLPDVSADSSINHALTRTNRRSIDWSQVRPEWGLSRHSAFLIGRRLLTQGINLEGRTFLHSYDYLQDPSGKYLEIIMTAPMIVANWINMEHYFSTVDPWVYGSGSKVYHNVVGRVGVMYGSQSDLRGGLPVQTVFDGEKPYHEPMRLFVIIEAPLERINAIISRQDILQRLLGNQWINLVSLDPVSMEFFSYYSENDWQLIR